VSTNLARAEAFRPAHDGEAEVGERVTVIDLTTGGVRDYRLVAPDAGQTAEDEVPISTALGAALLGRHVGDVVTTVGDGRASRLEIVEIDG
jgi:transcription elongation GreA/GreB family factor